MSSTTPGTLVVIAWFCVGPAAVQMEQAIADEDVATVRHLIMNRHTQCIDMRKARRPGVPGHIVETFGEQIHYGTTAWPFKALFYKIRLVNGKEVVTWKLTRMLPEV